MSAFFNRICKVVLHGCNCNPQCVSLPAPKVLCMLTKIQYTRVNHKFVTTSSFLNLHLKITHVTLCHVGSQCQSLSKDANIISLIGAILQRPEVGNEMQSRITPGGEINSKEQFFIRTQEPATWQIFTTTSMSTTRIENVDNNSHVNE